MRVRIVLFPFPFSPSPTSQHPCPPKKKTMVASWLYEMEISWPDIENFLQPACFLFYLPWFCLCTSFLALRDVLAPSRAMFLHLCLFALAAPQDAHSPYPVYLTNPSPFLKIQLKCCLSSDISLHSFPTQFISPTSPPIHNPLNDSIIHTVL